jgi:succinate-semialdehyde dehydrogenase
MKADHDTPCALSWDPAHDRVTAEYPFLDEEGLDEALGLAQAGFRTWAAQSILRRTQVLQRMAGILRRDVESFARMAGSEMGKPVAQARAEVLKCATLCEWYAGQAPALLADQPSSIPQAYTSLLPLGTILAVMPWNFPYWQILRGAVPILVAGNAYVLKPAPNVLGCSHLIRDAWLEAGLAPGAFSLANVTPELVSRAIADDRIAAVTVTGSVRAGAAIAAQAGAALKKSVLELGGSDAFIVLRDADLADAVKAAVIGRFQNSGQICIAAKRIILEAPIAEEFTARFVEAVSALKVGHPAEEDTYIGPMARSDLRNELHVQVSRSVAMGAEVLLGGGKLPREGNFYAPTVLGGVTPDMPVFCEETFGPVAALSVARDCEHALELANRSEYGLSGALWTRDTALAKELARRLDTGGVFINGFAASDPRLPIGGVKKSGYGRELAQFGIQEFMNVQTVWIDKDRS